MSTISLYSSHGSCCVLWSGFMWNGNSGRCFMRNRFTFYPDGMVEIFSSLCRKIANDIWSRLSVNKYWLFNKYWRFLEVTVSWKRGCFNSRKNGSGIWLKRHAIPKVADPKYYAWLTIRLYHVTRSHSITGLWIVLGRCYQAKTSGTVMPSY